MKKTGLHLKYEVGIWSMRSPAAAALLALMPTKEERRYALQCAFIDADCLTITDGRRLLSISLDDKKPDPGLYHISRDGYLVGPVDGGKFPNWKDLVLPEEKRKRIWKGGLDYTDMGIPLWAINHQADTAMSLELWFPAMKTLVALGADSIEIVRAKRQTQDVQIQIFGSLTAKEKFIYLQMPTSTGERPLK